MQPAKCRILCVDDHEDTSFMITHLLGGSNYEVVTASSISDALRLIEGQEFDLFILDKRMPDGSGLDLCQKLNMIRPNIPVILYSGDAYELHRQQGLCAGAEAYVSKPEIDKLIEAVQRLLAEKDCAAAVAG
jgi:CheY-like chemotaxis protein